MSQEEQIKKGVEIIDTLQLLSKNQKEKIKQWVKEGKSSAFILENIHYSPEMTDSKYNNMELKEEETKIICILKYDRSHLHRALKEKIKYQSKCRTSTLSPEWKLYHQLLQHPSIQALPDETIKKALPNPDEIKQKKDIYRMINQVNPNPLLKNYISECLK